MVRTVPPNGVIGIDPGGSGGIAYAWEGGAQVWKMPVTFRDQWNLIFDLSLIARAAMLEKVQAMRGRPDAHGEQRKQGVGSAFVFGKSAGALEMALTGAQIPFDMVGPVKWQNALGCRTGGDKNVSKAAAQRRWPDITMTHAFADALLIAEYGRVHADW